MLSDEFHPVHEPILDIHDIQGNAVPGFLKPFMALYALTIRDVPETKAWLRDLLPRLTTLGQVMPSRRRVREERIDRGVLADVAGAAPPGAVAGGALDDTWLNLAISHAGLSTLLAHSDQHLTELDEFSDEAFRLGLAARSTLLGDPSDPGSPGHVDRWVVTDPDILLVLGADLSETLSRLVLQINGQLSSSGMSMAYFERGGKLNPAGKEQFGYKDGISQPGIRGRLSHRADDYVTPRMISSKVVPDHDLYGLPGQYLVWPGEFIFGYPRQGADPLLPGAPNLPGPAWAANGSYLVFRRLRQDVAAFRQFVAESATTLRDRPDYTDITPELVGARLVGRWPSGAPVARAPLADDPALGADPLANNDFQFATDTATLPLVSGDTSHAYPSAKADPIGLTCPLPSHIRKVNSRDAANDQGGRRASFNRRLLRRGLPYGPPLPPGAPDDGEDRGLLFLSYQASITDQFEFLCSSWMGDATNPRGPSGFDMLVGQNGQPGQDRVRGCTLLDAEGQPSLLSTRTDFVVPTGGGYFFAPSLRALREVLTTPTR
jgi:Dyp-type peroxidase family